MEILLYRGKSLISRAIQLQTRSPYSHVAVLLDDNRVIEAWHVGGVCMRKDVHEGHKPGTVIDEFVVCGEYDPSTVESFLVGQIGKRYDFRNVFRFLSRRKVRDNDKWFCSELVVEAFRAGGLHLLNGPAAGFSPRDVGMSPFLGYDGRIIVVPTRDQ